MAVKDKAWTTAQRVADFSGLGTPTGTDLSVIERMIDACTDFCENYIGFAVKKTVYTNQEYDTEKGDVLLLENSPVIAGETFTMQRRNTQLNEDNWETVDTSYYHVDEKSGIVYASPSWGFPRTRRGVRISYTAGYDFDRVSTFLSETTAGDLELVMWMLVSDVYNRRLGGGSSVKSEWLGDYKVVYWASMMENETVKNILDKYVSISFGAPLTPINT